MWVLFKRIFKILTFKCKYSEKNVPKNPENVHYDALLLEYASYMVEYYANNSFDCFQDSVTKDSNQI